MIVRSYVSNRYPAYSVYPSGCAGHWWRFISHKNEYVRGKTLQYYDRIYKEEKPNLFFGQIRSSVPPDINRCYE